MLSQRTQRFGASGTAAARAAAAQAAAQGRTIIDLTAGEVDIAPPHRVRAGAMAAIEAGVSRYTDTLGMRPLRERVAEMLVHQTGHEWSADEVAMTTGAKQALFNAVLALVGPGDEVLIPVPHWTTFPAQVRLAGGVPVAVPTVRGVPTIEALQSAVTERTRAIIVNTPNNPTGAIYPPPLLARIANLACERDLWIVFDECYGAITHAPHTHVHLLKVAPEARERLVIVNSFSKALAMTGWRLGFLAAPREVIAAAKSIQSHTTSNPNVIAQHAVLAHLEAPDPRFAVDLADVLAKSRTVGLKLLEGLPAVPTPAAEGAFYFYLDLRALLGRNGTSSALRTADDVAAMLIRDAGVAVVSGSAFGDPTGLRVSFGVHHAYLRQGLSALVARLSEEAAAAEPCAAYDEEGV